MSGGSFNYLYDGISEHPLERYRDLIEMAEWLTDDSFGKPTKPEAAAVLRDTHDKIKVYEQEIEELLEPLLNLIKEVEWWASNDTGEEDFDKVWENYQQVMGG